MIGGPKSLGDEEGIITVSITGDLSGLLNGSYPDFAQGARLAHDMIVNQYLANTGTTNWITYNNIGNWGGQVVQSSSITEFIQYGNGRTTSAYYHAFKDDSGSPLNGADPRGYVLTFQASEIPAAQRFWSSRPTPRTQSNW